MRKCLFVMVGIFLPLVVFAQDASYLIGPSDILDVSVWGEESLSRQVTVRTDGFISLPLAGDLKASEKTPAELQKDIEAVLSKFIKQPHAAVIVREPRSKRFYVMGEVAHPGEFIQDSDLTLTQVISRAGGFTQWADTSCIVILRSDKEGQKRIEATTRGSSRARTRTYSSSPVIRS
jgi:polysaccharide export outer membrane protein